VTVRAALESLARGLEMAAASARALLEEQAGAPQWVDQNDSPLGRRRHLSLVRAGQLRGYKVGRLVLVSRDDLDQFIGGRGVRLSMTLTDEQAEMVEVEAALRKAAERSGAPKRKRRKAA
jgi:excisionase family DNA binding protein